MKFITYIYINTDNCSRNNKEIEIWYLYLLINYNSSRVLENDEVHSSSIDKYDRSFIYLSLLGNGLLNYVNFNG